MQNYGVNGSNLPWYESYVGMNRKQFLVFINNSMTLADMICGAPQGSILRPLLLLIYVRDFRNASDILFADDTNSPILIAILNPFLRLD